MLKQGGTHIGQYDQDPNATQAIEDHFNEILSKVLLGRADVNDAVDSYLKIIEENGGEDSMEAQSFLSGVMNDNPNFIKQIALEKRFKVLGGQRGNLLYRKIVGDVFKVDTEDLLELADTTETEYLEKATDFISQAGGGQRFFKSASGLISPSVAQFPMIKKYMDSALRRYFIAEMVAPKVEGSFKLPFFVHDFSGNKRDDGSKIKLAPGEVYLSQGLRDTKVKYEDGYKTLGEIDQMIQELFIVGK
jgi:hypothetical protein